MSAFNLNFYDKKANQVFYDTSEKIFNNYFISLNLVAKVCPEAKLSDLKLFDGFEINHHALPYFGYFLPEAAKPFKFRKRGSNIYSDCDPNLKELHQTLSTIDIQRLESHFKNHEGFV